MSWLDNSGNIVLDACLTDVGRFRLARGEFRIAKFAVLDDEIDYSLYNTNHPSGSAYYDLSILQTPIFEAFTNNGSYGTCKLLSIPRTNLLYLPVIKLNDVNTPSNATHSSGSFMLAVDSDTEDDFNTVTGFMMGESLNGGSVIRCDQGLDTTEISPGFTLDSDLVETQYSVQIDNRFAKVVSTNAAVARVSYIDDDQIASYFLSLSTDQEFVTENTERNVSRGQILDGPRGTILQFKLQSSLELNTSTYLFDQIGSTATMVGGTGANVSIYYIDSYITITGMTTGYSLQLPLRLVKSV